jgi:hypothetical protein
MGDGQAQDRKTETAATASETKVCPKCRAAMAETAVLCLSCGFNIETLEYETIPGSAVQDLNGKGNTRALAFTSAGVALLLGALSVYVYYEPIRLEVGTRLPAAMDEGLPPRISRPYYPLWMQSMTHDALAAVYQNHLAVELRNSHPPCHEGDIVTVVCKSGRTSRGIFRGSDVDCILIETDGKTLRIPFRDLDENCRLRLDMAGRAKYIYNRAEKAAGEYLNPAV